MIAGIIINDANNRFVLFPIVIFILRLAFLIFWYSWMYLIRSALSVMPFVLLYILKSNTE